MKKLATLFTDSYNELKYVRTITTMAMFAAISTVLGYFTLAIGDFIKIGFSSISNQMVYYLFGPAVGGIFGAALDIFKYIIKPTGPYFPGLTLVPMVAGILYGFILYKKPLTIWRVAAAELTVAMVCNVCMTTICLSVMYNKGIMVLLPLRFVKNIVMWPVNTILFYTVARALEGAGALKAIRGAKLGRIF